MAKIQDLIKKLRPPIYGAKTVRVAFEFGTVLSEVAKTNNIEMTGELVMRGEDVFFRELQEQGLQSVASNFTPLILSVLEPKD